MREMGEISLLDESIEESHWRQSSTFVSKLATVVSIVPKHWESYFFIECKIRIT